MKDSLRHKIVMALKTNNRMSIEQLEILCHREGRKISNGERRLRELQDRNHSSYNPRIGEIKNNKGAIIAYTYTLSEYEIMHQNYQRTNQLRLI